MIFFKQKIIFVHVPRCGGTSIEQNLWKKEFGEFFSFKNSDEKHLLQGFVDKYTNKYQSDGLQHLTTKNITKIYPKEMESFFSFAFVRNPYSRIASIYCEVMKYRKDLRDFLIIFKDSSFKNFLKLIKKNPHTHWMPMINFFSEKKLSFIGKFETFETDLKQIGKKIELNFSKENFSGEHKFSEKSDYLSFYEDKENISLVEEIYQDDLIQFDYSFKAFENFEKNKNSNNSIIPHIELNKKEVNLRRFFKRYFKKKIYMLFNNDKFKLK
ncbi:sulfotransferase family 2 domain-containing protein [Pelagibacterales bacterium SAG-MED39]|nr:sulfotransferase family 2 domain-containing protein [Pelagibacterales bacterium SAG-MED39]